MGGGGCSAGSRDSEDSPSSQYGRCTAQRQEWSATAITPPCTIAETATARPIRISFGPPAADQSCQQSRRLVIGSSTSLRRGPRSAHRCRAPSPHARSRDSEDKPSSQRGHHERSAAVGPGALVLVRDAAVVGPRQQPLVERRPGAAAAQPLEGVAVVLGEPIIGPILAAGDTVANRHSSFHSEDHE
jgi:hypothetical protein